MSKLDDAKSVADLYLEEILATLEIRNSYNSIILPHSTTLFGALAHDNSATKALSTALKYKTADPSALYKPLLVQVHGVFENYIRSMVGAIVEDRFEITDKYPNLTHGFRQDHIVHAAKVLTHIKAGNILGSPYNFDILLTNLGKGLSGQTGYKLNPEIYTKLMGNCTPERLESLFKALALPEPFSDALGKNGKIKDHFDDKTKGRVAIRAKEKLETQINLRNDIVHGDLTKSVNIDELRDGLNFFRALIAGFDQLVRI